MAKLTAEHRALLKRLDALREQAFPEHTTPACRHAALIGEALLRGRPYPMLTEEPAHCAESILHAVAMLWETKLAASHPQGDRTA